MNKKFTASIAGASVLLTFIGLISRGFGFIREIVFANNFGLQTNFDVYLIGAVIPITLNTSVIYLAQNYFIPAYYKKLQEGEESAKKFFNDSFWMFIFSSTLISLILFISSGYLIKIYLPENPELYQTALTVFRIFLITIPFNAGFAILTSYSNARFNFKTPAVSALFQNLIIILLVLVFSKSAGIYSIPAGYLSGTIIQFIYLFFNILRRDKEIFKGLSFNIAELGFVNKILIFNIFVEVINQLYILVDRYFYKSVEPGGIAALNYAMVLFTLPVSLFSLALSTAIFPKLSQALNEKKQEMLQSYFTYGIKINLFLFIPITFICAYFGDSIIRLFYQRGIFSSHDTNTTYQVLKIYSFSLIFYTSYAILNKIIFGAGLIKNLLLISFVILFVKIILSYFFVEKFMQNGLAAATSICYIVLSISSYIVIFRKLHLKDTRQFFISIIFYVLNSFTAYAVLKLAEPLMEFSFIVNFILSAGIFCTVYFINLVILAPTEYLIFREALYNGIIGKRNTPLPSPLERG